MQKKGYAFNYEILAWCQLRILPAVFKYPASTPLTASKSSLSSVKILLWEYCSKWSENTCSHFPIPAPATSTDRQGWNSTEGISAESNCSLFSTVSYHPNKRLSCKASHISRVGVCAIVSSSNIYLPTVRISPFPILIPPPSRCSAATLSLTAAGKSRHRDQPP